MEDDCEGMDKQRLAWEWCKILSKVQVESYHTSQQNMFIIHFYSLSTRGLAASCPIGGRKMSIYKLIHCRKMSIYKLGTSDIWEGADQKQLSCNVLLIHVFHLVFEAKAAL